MDTQTAPATQAATTRRPVCQQCLRPQSACICRWATPIPHATEVLILQHPLEVTNAKNSARLLHLCLPGSHLEIGEWFSPERLGALLQPPPSGRTLLLYPGTPDGQTSSAPAAPCGEAQAEPKPQAATPLRLVVLDATWRKSRKMLHLNPALQALPRLSLDKPPNSRYLIRKAHAPGQLSTFEATFYALMGIEAAPERLLPLLAAFDGFVAQQQACVPAPPPHNAGRCASSETQHQ